MKLLLASSSVVHGTGYLEHCADALREHYAGARRVLFVPFAVGDVSDRRGIVEDRFRSLGLEVDWLGADAGARHAVLSAEAVFVSGGNTFRLLATLYELDLVDHLRSRVLEGLPYAGASAGSNLACPTIRTTNDMPIVQPPTFAALDLVPFQINAHYIDADPTSTHQGETREQRIREFHEENTTPVVGLREGSWLEVQGDEIELRGTAGARVFMRGAEPFELVPPTALPAALTAPSG